MNVDTTQELAAFLRIRRERLAPIGLPDGRRARRTPGLRREEVAELAGVSVDYVVRLEQGRGLRPSPEVLDALAGALRLSADERTYLFDLVQQRSVSGPRLTELAAPPLARLVDDLSPLPVILINHRFDILAWNREMAGLILDFGELPEEYRNTLWLCLLHPPLYEFYIDREQTVRESIADLRAAWAARPRDSALAALVDEFRSRSTEFERLWALRDVQVNGRGQKRLRHPRLGPLTVEYEALVPLQDPDQRLVVYRGADDSSRAALATIASQVADAPLARQPS